MIIRKESLGLTPEQSALTGIPKEFRWDQAFQYLFEALDMCESFRVDPEGSVSSRTNDTAVRISLILERILLRTLQVPKNTPGDGECKLPDWAIATPDEVRSMDPKLSETLTLAEADAGAYSFSQQAEGIRHAATNLRLSGGGDEAGEEIARKMDKHAETLQAASNRLTDEIDLTINAELGMARLEAYLAEPLEA